MKYYIKFIFGSQFWSLDQFTINMWGIKFEFNNPHLCTNRERRKSGKRNAVQIDGCFMTMISYCSVKQELIEVENHHEHSK